MGTQNSKSCFSCTNERVVVNRSPLSTSQERSLSAKRKEPKPTLSHSKTTQSQNNVSGVSSRSPDEKFEYASELIVPERPCLENNFSADTLLPQVSALEDEEDNDLIDVPPMVAKIIKPENARKNVMDSFEIIQTLGNGVSSCVFEVRNAITGQRYALKRLERTQTHSDALFVSECTFLKFLKCQGVIRIIDTFVDENYFYELNEFATTDLFRKIKEHKRISERDAKQVIFHLLETLKQLHHCSLVHRDIKPENVVFTDKESNFPKLIDFGDATVVSDNQLYTDLVGTECYLAPERWRPHYGWELKAADVWAIGVLTFEMVTGKRCFSASSKQGLIRKIEEGHFKFPENLKLSRLCCHFIRSLLTVESNCRPTAEFALYHPWLSNCNDTEVQSLLAESWNANVAKLPNWIVYDPRYIKNVNL